MLPWQPFLAFYTWGAHWRHLKNTTEPSMCGGDVALCQITLTTCLKRLKRAGLLLEQDCYHRIYCNFTRHQSECASPVCIPLSPSLKPSIWRPFSIGLSISFFCHSLPTSYASTLAVAGIPSLFLTLNFIVFYCASVCVIKLS